MRVVCGDHVDGGDDWLCFTAFESDVWGWAADDWLIGEAASALFLAGHHKLCILSQVVNLHRDLNHGKCVQTWHLPTNNIGSLDKNPHFGVHSSHGMRESREAPNITHLLAPFILTRWSQPALVLSMLRAWLLL